MDRRNIAIVLGITGAIATYFAYRYKGWVWALSIGSAMLILALAVYAWPDTNPGGQNCTEDVECVKTWEGSLREYKPCDKEQGKLIPVADQLTAPCRVECPVGQTPYVDEYGNKMCAVSGTRQCIDGTYQCEWLAKENRWRATLNGEEVPENRDSRGHPICGAEGVEFPEGWVPDIHTKFLFRQCGGGSWTDPTKYSAFTCGPNLIPDEYACVVAAPGQLCNASNRGDGIMATPADQQKTNEAAYYDMYGKTSGAVAYARGVNNEGASLPLFFPCKPGNESYSNWTKPIFCEWGPRCLAYAVVWGPWICPNIFFPSGGFEYAVYMAFFFMEDNSMRWLCIDKIDRNQRKNCIPPLVLWDWKYRHTAQDHDLALPLMHSNNYRQLDGYGSYPRWSGEGEAAGTSIEVEYAGRLVESRRVPVGASERVFKFTGMEYKSDSPFHFQPEWKLIVHDNLYPPEAIVNVCQSAVTLPPAFGGKRDKNLDWRFKNIPDDYIGRD